MNKVYDNGEKLLGKKNDIEKYCLKLIIRKEDCDVVDGATEILEEIKYYNDSDILCINYDNGMGLYTEKWEEIDEV